MGRGFEMGIGLNSGPVMSGQVGSERRIEYTAIGDTTNTAARLEGMTKGSGHQLFVADSTRRALAGRGHRAGAGRRARGPRPRPRDHRLGAQRHLGDDQRRLPPVRQLHEPVHHPTGTGPVIDDLDHRLPVVGASGGDRRWVRSGLMSEAERRRPAASPRSAVHACHTPAEERSSPGRFRPQVEVRLRLNSSTRHRGEVRRHRLDGHRRPPAPASPTTTSPPHRDPHRIRRPFEIAHVRRQPSRARRRPASTFAFR